MAKMAIPSIGSVIVLTEEWDFDLYFDYKNYPLIQALYAGPEYVAPPIPKDQAAYYKNNTKWWDQYNRKQHGTKPEEWHGDERYRVMKAEHPNAVGVTSREKHWIKEDRPYLAIRLPAGTPLRVDRVQIKRGLDVFSNLYMGITKECLNKKLRGKRFWATLKDVNRMICEVI
jgi:hypothetical protein